MSGDLTTGGGARRTTSFWNRPEGTTGKFLVGAVVLVLVGLFVYLLPTLLQIAEDTIKLGIMAAVIAAMVFLLTADRPRTLLFYAFQMLSRWLTSNFVDIDPVAILKAFTRQMRQKRAGVEASIARVMAVSRTLQDEVRRSEREMHDALRLADAAERQGDEDALNVQAEKAGRRDQNIREYREMHAVVQEILDALQRVKRRVDYHIANSEDEVQELVRKNEIAIATRDATSSASAVLGDSDLLEVRNMAADRIRERYSSALGELDSLIYMSHDLDKEIDLNQLAFRSDGRKKLDELRQRLVQVERGDGAPRELGRGPAAYSVPNRTPPDRATSPVSGPAAPDDGASTNGQRDGDRWSSKLRQPRR